MLLICVSVGTWSTCEIARGVAIISGALWLRRRAPGECGSERPPGGGPGAARRQRLRRGEEQTRLRPSETGRMRQDGCCETGEVWKRCDTPLSLLPVLGARNLQRTLRDSMLRSQLPVYTMLRDVAGMSHLTILFGVVRDEIRWCLQCVIVSGLDCSVLLWIFDLVCSVWHCRGVTSRSLDLDFDGQWYMSHLEMVDQTWPNSQVFQTRNPPKSSEPTHVTWRHLQRRPPDRGSGPLAWAAEGGHLEVVQALLAAGASVEAKNDFGRGPQRRDRDDRTDVVGRRCHGFQDEIRWCLPP